MKETIQKLVEDSPFRLRLVKLAAAKAADSETIAARHLLVQAVESYRREKR